MSKLAFGALANFEHFPRRRASTPKNMSISRGLAVRRLGADHDAHVTWSWLAVESAGEPPNEYDVSTSL
jgi:hypothetical protein